MKLFEVTQATEEHSILTTMGKQPSHVDGSFHCQYKRLTSLEGAPQSVGGDFWCHGNFIQSFRGVNKIIKQVNGNVPCDKAKDMLGLATIKGIKRVIVVDDPKLTQLFDQYLHDINLLQDALIDAGYEEQARL